MNRVLSLRRLSAEAKYKRPTTPSKIIMARKTNTTKTMNKKDLALLKVFQSIHKDIPMEELAQLVRVRNEDYQMEILELMASEKMTFKAARAFLC